MTTLTGVDTEPFDETLYINASFSVAGYDLATLMNKVLLFGAVTPNISIERVCKTFMLFVKARESNDFCNREALLALHRHVELDTRKFLAIVHQCTKSIARKRSEVLSATSKATEDTKKAASQQKSLAAVRTTSQILARLAKAQKNSLVMRAHLTVLSDLCSQMSQNLKHIEKFAPWRFTLCYLAKKCAAYFEKVFLYADSKKYDAMLEQCGGVDFSDELQQFDDILCRISRAFVYWTPEPVSVQEFARLRRQLLAKIMLHYRGKHCETVPADDSVSAAVTDVGRYLPPSPLSLSSSSSSLSCSMSDSDDNDDDEFYAHSVGGGDNRLNQGDAIVGREEDNDTIVGREEEKDKDAMVYSEHGIASPDDEIVKDFCGQFCVYGAIGDELYAQASKARMAELFPYEKVVVDAEEQTSEKNIQKKVVNESASLVPQTNVLPTAHRCQKDKENNAVEKHDTEIFPNAAKKLDKKPQYSSLWLKKNRP